MKLHHVPFSNFGEIQKIIGAPSLQFVEEWPKPNGRNKVRRKHVQYQGYKSSYNTGPDSDHCTKLYNLLLVSREKGGIPKKQIIHNVTSQVYGKSELPPAFFTWNPQKPTFRSLQFGSEHKLLIQRSPRRSPPQLESFLRRLRGNHPEAWRRPVGARVE